MKKKIYFVLILFLSGWIFSGIQYFIFKKERDKLSKEIAQMEKEILTYKSFLKEVERAKEEIDNILKSLTELKMKLQEIEEKVKKGE